MRIVVNHLTRMRAPRICVAGLSPTSFEHVRPTTYPGDQLTRKLLREDGGPLKIGAEVELGATRYDGAPPELEDRRIDAGALQLVRDLQGDELIDLLDDVAQDDLQAAFDNALERRKWKYAAAVGTGSTSLAVLQSSSRPQLEIDDTYERRLQLIWRDPDPPAYLPINGVRFYEADHQTIRTGTVAEVLRRLRRGVECWLMLGLTRAWKPPGDTVQRHWLQLNGLVLADRPVGEAP